MAPCASRSETDPETQKKVPMDKRLVRVDGDDFSGWCCSRCTWGMTTPLLESTVAALAFNRVAQEDFERHACAREMREDA